jgi:hypothetical protein
VSQFAVASSGEGLGAPCVPRDAGTSPPLCGCSSYHGHACLSRLPDDPNPALIPPTLGPSEA